jgi:hypothetical protein
MNTNSVGTLDYLNRQLIDAIELAKSTGTNAVDFVKEQAPDVVNQLILWEIWFHGLWVVVGLILLLVGAVFSVKLWKKFSVTRYPNDGAYFGFGFVATIVAVGGAVLLFVNTPLMLKPIVAPKVWLIEYVANLIKN